MSSKTNIDISNIKGPRKVQKTEGFSVAKGYTSKFSIKNKMKTDNPEEE